MSCLGDDGGSAVVGGLDHKGVDAMADGAVGRETVTTIVVGDEDAWARHGGKCLLGLADELEHSAQTNFLASGHLHGGPHTWAAASRGSPMGHSW